MIKHSVYSCSCVVGAIIGSKRYDDDTHLDDLFTLHTCEYQTKRSKFEPNDKLAAKIASLEPKAVVIDEARNSTQMFRFVDDTFCSELIAETKRCAEECGLDLGQVCAGLSEGCQLRF